MQAVHVLSDEAEMLVASFQFNDGMVGRIWRFRSNQFTPPVVPFPDQPRVSGKGFSCREIFCAVSAPQAVSPAKGRHTAIRGNSSSCEDGHVSSGGEVRAGEEDLIVGDHGRMFQL